MVPIYCPIYCFPNILQLMPQSIEPIDADGCFDVQT